jgi:hypothetical protein
MIPEDLDVFLAEQRRADAVRALAKAKTESEVAAVVRRLDLPPQGEGGVVAERVPQ